MTALEVIDARLATADDEPDSWTLGRWGSAPVLALALLGLVLMAAGSLLEL